MKTIHTQDGKTIEIQINKRLFGKNNEIAAKNLEFLKANEVESVDVLGSIGSGKTSVIQQLVKNLNSKKRIAAITGDLTTTIDADRIGKYGAHVLQINTDQGCHLDANMVRNAFDQLDMSDYDLIFIENVGNLICPGSYPVGAHQRIVVVSTTEGPYMIVKHPHIFRDATVVIINKIDMAEAMGVDVKQLKKDALTIKPSIKVVFTCAKTGEGIEELISALNI